MNSPAAAAPSNTTEYFYGLLTVLLSIFIIATIYFVTQYSRARTHTSVEEIIGAPLSGPFSVANSFKTGGGKILEATHPESGTRLKLVVADEPLGSGISLQHIDILSVVLAYQRERQISPSEVPPLLVKYGAAQFDKRKVSNFQSKSFDVGAVSFTGKTFLSTKSDFYLLLAFQSKLGPALLIADHRGAEVDTTVVARFMEQIL